MSLRLVSDQPDLERGKPKSPKLAVIEGGGEPAPSYDPVWRQTPTGRLLPQTHKWRRIRLSLQYATKEWRARAGELERATDALSAANDCDLDAALTHWRNVAARAITTENPRAFREKVALAAIISDVPFTYGGWLDHPTTAAEWAFAALDWVARGVERHAEQRKPGL
jgi:hypothetical protein